MIGRPIHRFLKNQNYCSDVYHRIRNRYERRNASWLSQPFLDPLLSKTHWLFWRTPATIVSYIWSVQPTPQPCWPRELETLSETKSPIQCTSKLTRNGGTWSRILKMSILKRNWTFTTLLSVTLKNGTLKTTQEVWSSRSDSILGCLSLPKCLV